MLIKQLKREQIAPFLAYLPTCLIGMEAYGGAQHWARKLQSISDMVERAARDMRLSSSFRSCDCPFVSAFFKIGLAGISQAV